MGQLDLEVLKELELNDEYIATACRWKNPFFSSKFVDDLRKEVLRNIPLVKIGIYELSQADVLAINFLNDLCEYQLSKKLIIKQDED